MAFAIHQHELGTGIYMSPSPEAPSHIPHHPIRLSCPRALALGALLHALNLSILHMVMYLFQCYSLKWPHTCLLPLSTIPSLEIETVIKNLPINKSPGIDGFTGEFYKKLREDLAPMLLKLFQKIAEGRKLPNSFYKATVILIPKPDKDATKKKKKRKRNKTTGQYHWWT